MSAIPIPPQPASAARDSVAKRPTAYPLQHVFWQIGLVAAAIGGTILSSPLAFVSILVLFLCMGLLWRRGEPALAWCIAYQWLFVAAGHAYWLMTGQFPDSHNPRELETAVWLSLLGLLVMSIGIRAALSVMGRRTKILPGEADTITHYSIPKLCAAAIVLSSIDWMVHISPMTMFFGGAQIIYRLLEFRGILFFLLLLAALRQRRGYGYCAAAAVFLWLPSLSSPMSSFSGVFITVLLALACEWRPWSSGLLEKVVARRRFNALVAVSIVLGVLAIGWSGAVKGPWRERVLSGEVSRETVTAAGEFMQTAHTYVPRMEWDDGVRALCQRLSSGLGYFSIVLDRVPRLLPHEDGALSMRAVEHAMKPRLLFPDKPILESSSWQIRRYADEWVAGGESNTSIGLGYMAEFYIDFGALGMFVPLFLYGGLVGLLYRGLRLVTSSYDFFRAATVAVLLQHFSGYEGELVKNLGGMLQAFIIFGLAMALAGRWMHRSFAKSPVRWRSLNGRQREGAVQ
ncbi:MAG TPA: O-antigen polymerase [Blastocatellia bacterium]|nr:O-antigen polymerase [Blastocatellia bacterium]